MNRILTSILSGLNAVIAIAVIAISAKLGEGFFGGPGGLLLGGAIGIVIASLACGLIAYLALIEDHLRKMVELGGGRASGPSLYRDDGRIDPRL